MPERGLPCRYLITPPCGDDEAAFLVAIRRALDSGIGLLRLRPGVVSTDALRRLHAACLGLCQAAGAELLVGWEAWRLGLRSGVGLHLDRHALRCLERRPDRCQLLAASCHDEAEIALAARLACDFIVCSPVRATPSHPAAEPLGWEGFSRLVSQAPMPVFALGGMQEADLAEVRCRGGYGIAAIRAFWHEARA